MADLQKEKIILKEIYFEGVNEKKEDKNNNS